MGAVTMILSLSLITGASAMATTEEGTVLFAGRVSLENNGGFASIRSGPRRWDLDAYSGIAMRFRGELPWPRRASKESVHGRLLSGTCSADMNSGTIRVMLQSFGSRPNTGKLHWSKRR